LLCFGAYVTSNKASFEQMRCFNQFFMIFLSEPFISKEVSKNKKKHIFVFQHCESEKMNIDTFGTT